ncbi:MAG: hypothetical protein Q9175_000125 [Cornicularia normoerica]
MHFILLRLAREERIQYTNIICIIIDNINPTTITPSSEEPIHPNIATTLPTLHRKLVTTTFSVVYTHAERVCESTDELLVVTGPVSWCFTNIGKGTVAGQGVALLSNSVACSWLIWAAGALATVTR